MSLKGTLRSTLTASMWLTAAGVCLPAAAAPVLTWAPQGSAPPLSSNAPQFSFSDITLQDLATVYLTPDGHGGLAFTESGYLPAVAFNGLTPAGLNGSGSPNPYGLMGMFTATGDLSNMGGSTFAGTFSSVNFTLLGDPGYLNGEATLGFNASAQVGANSNTTTPYTGAPTGDVVLATGTLTGGQNNAGLAADGVPSGAVTTTFVQALGQSGFFISPPSTVNLDLFGSFINNITQIECFAAAQSTCGGDAYGGAVPSGAPAGTAIALEIGGTGLPGGADADFTAVPEPGSLALLGSALAGLGGLVRLRRRRSA